MQPSHHPPVILAAPHNDADGRLYDQTARLLPLLTQLFAGLALHVTDGTQPRSLALLEQAGAHMDVHPAVNHTQLGIPRRAALQLAVHLDAPCILFCDFDRLLHWAEFHLDELRTTFLQIPQADCTILGRTPAAFDSHPRVQRDTEAIVNHVFAQVSGQAWDITAAARGFSRRAALAVVQGCPDETVGTDASWPLFLRRTGGFTISYRAAQGLEFETPDRYADQIAAAGGLAAWIARIDADPQAWALRLAIAEAEVRSMIL